MWFTLLLPAVWAVEPAELLKVDVEPDVPQRKDLLKVLERPSEVPRGARQLFSPLLPPVAAQLVLVQQVELQQALALPFPLQMRLVSVPLVWELAALASQMWRPLVWQPAMCHPLRQASEPQVVAQRVLPGRSRLEPAVAALVLASVPQDPRAEPFPLRLQQGPMELVF